MQDFLHAKQYVSMLWYNHAPNNIFRSTLNNWTSTCWMKNSKWENFKKNNSFWLSWIFAAFEASLFLLILFGHCPYCTEEHRNKSLTSSKHNHSLTVRAESSLRRKLMSHFHCLLQYFQASMLKKPLFYSEYTKAPQGDDYRACIIKATKGKVGRTSLIQWMPTFFLSSEVGSKCNSNNTGSW